MLTSVFHWLKSEPLRSRARRQKRHRPPGCPRRSLAPCLEVLGERVLLSTLTVLNLADSGPGSLRATIAAASSGDTINFAARLNYHTITLTGGQLAVGKNLDIEGPGANKLTNIPPSAPPAAISK